MAAQIDFLSYQQILPQGQIRAKRSPWHVAAHAGRRRVYAISSHIATARQAQTPQGATPNSSAAKSPFIEVDSRRPWDWQDDSKSGSSGMGSQASASLSADLSCNDTWSTAGLWQSDVLRMADAVASLKCRNSNLALSFPVDPPSAESTLCGHAFDEYPSSAKETNVLRENRESLSGVAKDSGDGSSDGHVAVDDVEMEERLPEMKEMLALLQKKSEERKKKREEDGDDGDSSEEENGCGSVWLVGTGPGDPELLTVKAVRILQSADLILYDRLVTLDVLRLASPSALFLYVGKASGYHTRTQQEILALLLAFAHAGAIVVRLKGGDPLVFGRGGEEIEYLQANGVAVHVVPGITAASGISAGLGIPLTHRGIANSVRFLTGHLRKGGGDPLQVVSSAAIDRDCTLVVYMGLASLPALTARLLEAGLEPDTPAVLVERGTTPMQRTVFSHLKDLPDMATRASLVSPTLIIIGFAVALSPFWPLPQPVTPPAAAASPADSLPISSVSAEPRDRSLREPDPLLPSQRERQQ